MSVMGIKVTREVKALLAAGKYRIREVHIAEQFHLRDYSCSDFLLQLMRKLNESHVVQRINAGRGFRINAQSRSCSVIVYNKLFEFHRRALPQYSYRVNEATGFARAGLIVDREFQQHVAALGPRLEIRLTSAAEQSSCLEVFAISVRARGDIAAARTAGTLTNSSPGCAVSG